MQDLLPDDPFDIDPTYAKVVREYLLSDFYQFARFCFWCLKGTAMQYVDYYEPMYRAIQMAIDGKTSKLVLTAPPRSGKTLAVSQILPVYAFCISPNSNIMNTGCNSDVLEESSGFVISIMENPWFQCIMSHVSLDKNKKSVRLVGTTKAGALHAIPLTGKLIGKGAGDLGTKYAGHLCIDDSMKARQSLVF